MLLSGLRSGAIESELYLSAFATPFAFVEFLATGDHCATFVRRVMGDDGSVECEDEDVFFEGLSIAEVEVFRILDSSSS